MKIAVFHNLLSGGAKRALYDNVEFLSKDHEVDVFIPSIAEEDYLPLKEIADNLYTFEVKNTLPGFIYSAIKYFPSKVSLRDLEKTQKHMAEVVNQGDHDVVLCEQDKYTMAPFFLKYLKKPHVYYCQQPMLSQTEISKNLYKKAGIETKNNIETARLNFYGSRMVSIDRELANYSKYTVVNSYFSHESILRSYGTNSFVSYLGVNSNLFKPINIPKEDFVLSVGRCIPEKGFDFIIKTLAKIDKKSRPELVIVSDLANTIWKEYLENLAIQLKVKLRIFLLISDDELVKLYNQARLVVYAPYLEPFGLVPLEAMSCGTPVVAVKEGGVRETVLHKSTGILTDRDLVGFSKEITLLLGDDHVIEKYATNSIKLVNDFWTLRRSGKRILNHLIRAIEYHDF
jgi:glycosyltransferase involved in cell wall biosynthesis